MKFITSLLTVLALSFSSIFAQQSEVERPDPENPIGENLSVPSNWEVRLDHPEKDATIGDDPETADIYFVNMVPGWHITTGPRAIFYITDNRAIGTYRVSTDIHLFDPKGRNEAFGIFTGGQNLQQENQFYTYFLLRNSGEYLIKKRRGEETKIVKDWTKTEAMVQYRDTTEHSVLNSLSMEIMDEKATFYVNGTKVESLPVSKIDTDGIVGLRVNHLLNLHVEDLSVEPLQ